MTDIGPGPGNIGGFIRQAITEGLGVTEARNLFRETGVGRMSNAAFGQLYGQVRAAIGQRDVLAGIDYNALPPGDAYTPWAAGRADRYASFVEVQVREIGTREVTSRFHQFVTNAPHTPQEAVDAAMQVVSNGSEDGTTPSGEIVLAGFVTSMTRTVARAI